MIPSNILYIKLVIICPSDLTKKLYYKLLPSSESLSFINEYLFDLASAKIPCIGSDIFFSVSNNHRKRLLCIILHVIYSPLMHFNARSVHRQTLPGKVAPHWIFRGTSRVKLAIFFFFLKPL